MTRSLRRASQSATVRLRHIVLTSCRWRIVVVMVSTLAGLATSALPGALAQTSTVALTIYSYDGERQFPDDWVQFPRVGSP